MPAFGSIVHPDDRQLRILTGPLQCRGVRHRVHVGRRRPHVHVAKWCRDDGSAQRSSTTQSDVCSPLAASGPADVRAPDHDGDATDGAVSMRRHRWGWPPVVPVAEPMFLHRPDLWPCERNLWRTRHGSQRGRRSRARTIRECVGCRAEPCLKPNALSPCRQSGTRSGLATDDETAVVRYFGPRLLTAGPEPPRAAHPARVFRAH